MIGWGGTGAFIVPGFVTKCHCAIRSHTLALMNTVLCIKRSGLNWKKFGLGYGKGTLTVSSLWAHGTLTVRPRYAHFSDHGTLAHIPLSVRWLSAHSPLTLSSLYAHNPRSVSWLSARSSLTVRSYYAHSPLSVRSLFRSRNAHIPLSVRWMSAHIPL